MDSKAFSNKLAIQTGISPEEVGEKIRQLADLLAQSIMEGDTVAIPAFGSFEPKLKPERVAVHPATGRKLLVPPKMSMVFKPSAVLKQKVR